MDGISKEQFTQGTIWKVLERFTGRGISLIISVILARLLTPDDYGLIALTTVFTNLSEILIDAGFSTALVQKKEVDDTDYSCVFMINSMISVILYVALFLAAPFVSRYYMRPELVAVLRVMSLVLFIQAFGSTRNAYVTRNMLFKLQMKCNTVAVIISGTVGIIMARCGIGVWALVFQRLLQQLTVTVVLFVCVRWKPRFGFSFEKYKELLGFSLGVIGASLVNYVENCVNSLVIGKRYSVAELGYYDKGNILPEQISLNSFGSMTSVLLPTVSSYQGNIERLRHIIRKIYSYTTYLLFPIMLGMLAVSKETVIILFTEKWLPSVPLMQCICIYYIATPLMLIDVQVFFGLGHSEVRIKTELYRMIFILIGVFSCCFVFKLDIQYLALTNAIAASLGTIVTHIEVKNMIGYTLLDRFKDMYKSLVSAGLMCVIVAIVKAMLKSVGLPTIIELVIEIMSGVGSYILLSILFRIDNIYEIFEVLKNKGIVLMRGKNG